MGRPLAYLLTYLAYSPILLAGGNAAFDEAHLAYEHQKIAIREMYFVSEKYAIGVGEINKKKETPLYLFNENNLIVDTFYSGKTTVGLLPQNDSIIFIQEKERTIEVLLREEKLLLQNCLSIPDQAEHFECKTWQYPLILNNHVVGQYFPNRKAVKNNQYELRLKDFSRNNSHSSLLKNEDGQKTSKASLKLAVNDDQLLALDRQKSSFFIFDLGSKGYKAIEMPLKKETDWTFFFDHVKKNIVLVEQLKKDKYQLYSLNDANLIPIEEVSDEPFGVVNGKVHYITKNKSVYTHHLVPLSGEQEALEPKFLDEVQIIGR